jgi:hypothetical protein
LAFLLLAAFSLAPLLFETRPVQFLILRPGVNLAPQKALIGVLLALPIALRIGLDGWTQRRGLWIGCALVLLSGCMTALHWRMVDVQSMDVRTEERGQEHVVKYHYAEAWQRDLYLKVFNSRVRQQAIAGAPHVFRPLPYGFARSLERLTGDWWFACVAYRWFFNFWLLWASFRFVRLFDGPARAALAVGILFVLYPFSIANFYLGQLTDPMSHALFVLGLVFLVEDRWLALLAAVVLGVLAKETAALLVPAYLACYWRQGLGAVLKTAGLSLASGAAFLAARLPLGWRPGSGLIHSIPGLMIGSNLGIGGPLVLSTELLHQNYLQPLLFIGLFLPFIFWKWRRTDTRLKALFLTLTPLLLLTCLSFSWLYESRNYVPLLPILCAMALGPSRNKP